MRRTIIIGIALLMATSVEARVRWPWEVPRHHVRSHHNGKVVVREVMPPPNCDQINAAIKALSPTNYEQAMRSSTKKQKEYIAKCQAGTTP